MQPGVARTELSVGYTQSRTGRVVSLVLAGVLLVGACCGVGAISAHLVAQGASPGAAAVVALLFAGTAALAMTLLVVWTARAGAALAGTELTVRGLVSRTVDLRSATAVTLHAMAQSQAGVASDGSVVATGGVTRVPVLTVTTPGRTVRLRLRSLDGVLLPAGQMVALADALGWARCPGAREAADWLRAMAADPRTMLL
ncbi:hypothetical protein [Micromonospora rosaria]|nr:hypothetical protein [Micromonospora rosaria]